MSHYAKRAPSTGSILFGVGMGGRFISSTLRTFVGRLITCGGIHCPCECLNKGGVSSLLMTDGPRIRDTIQAPRSHGALARSRRSGGVIHADGFAKPQAVKTKGNL